MLEPTVLDYVRAAGQLDQERFCRQFPHPVLVSLAADLGHAFREVRTRLCGPAAAGAEDDPSIRAVAPVLAVRSDGGDAAGAEISLGRSEDCDLVIDHETVSSTQAVLLADPAGGGWRLLELEVTNPSRVNDRPLAPGQAVGLSDGDKLAFGDCRFVFYSPAGFFQMLQPNG